MNQPARRVHYGKLPGLKDVYLEDSWVLGVSEEPGTLRFTLQIVLRENHASYEKPKFGERYCYRLGVLEFRNVSNMEWQRRTMLKYRDAERRVDYGNIDVFFRERDGAYHIEGDWGVVDVVSGPPVITMAS